MAFPNAPIDQQIATVNNIKYIYNSADNSWTKTGEVSDFQIEGNLNVTGNAIITAGVYAQGYFYANGVPFVSGGGTGVLNNWTLITANYTASTGDRILANTAAGAFTIFLPAAPTLGENIQITDAYNFGDNALIINPNGSTIEGLSDEIEVNIPALDLELVYGENTWQLITTIGPQGLQGNIGYTGSQGAGYTGSQGVAGTQGNVGYTGSSGTLTNWTTVTANYTAVSGDRIIANTSVGSFVITLPAGPALGDFIQITDGYNFAVNPITVNLNGSTLESQSNNVIIDIPAVDVELIYDGNTWQVINSAGPQGSAGYTGSAGTPGSVGYTGSAGANGTIGVDGYTGSQGAIGYTGSQGSVGFTGSKGDTGLGFRIAKSYLTLAALQADTSPTGIVAGEFAIIETGNVEDADNSKLYLWNGSSYTYVNDLSGAAGITGPQGYSGSAGSIGYTGSQGIIGYTGSAGINGTSANIQVQDANVTITNTVTSINFVGGGIAATAVDGNVTVVVPGLLIDGASSLNFVRSFTGNGATTAYNLQGTILDAAQLMVHVDGIYQIPGVNFTANAEWVNFSAAPDANAEIVIQSYTSALLAEPLIAGANTATSVNVQPSILDTFSSTDYRTAKYIISASAAGEYQSSEVLVTHDDTTAFITVYAVLTTGNSEIITFSANVVSSNVKLYGTSVSGVSQVKLQRTYVRV